jgi:hypothetical protein
MRKNDQGGSQTNQRQHEVEDAAWRSAGFKRHLDLPSWIKSGRLIGLPRRRQPKTPPHNSGEAFARALLLQRL